MDICCCLCFKEPAPRCQCCSQAVWVPAWTAVCHVLLWNVVSQYCCLCVQNPREWEQDKKKKKKKTKQMQNLCIWGLLFLCILRAYGGTLVYSCLGYVIDLLPMKCNSFFYSSGFCQWLKMNRVSAYLQPKITHWLCCPRTSRSCTAAWAVPGRGAFLLFLLNFLRFLWAPFSSLLRALDGVQV